MWKIGVGLFLFMGMLWDIRKREVPMVYLLIGTIGAVAIQIWQRPQLWYECLLGVIIGILFCLLSKVTKEQIGYGDSWMILNLGICFGAWKLLAILALGFGVCSLITVVGVLRKKLRRKERIPFYPFLMIGVAGVMLW